VEILPVVAIGTMDLEWRIALDRHKYRQACAKKNGRISIQQSTERDRRETKKKIECNEAMFT
jgi:hypothetical protein